MTRNKPMKVLKFAASVAALSLAPFAAQAAECFDRDTDDPKAGNATAVVGPAVDVERLNRDGAFRPASGADMFTGDTVRTGDASHLQLKLCDWSTYTFSPNSESAISEFFDARGAGRRRVVNFFRGGFRFSSGRDSEPGSTEVQIQDSGVTMGVRGTNVIIAEVDGVVYALLEGPVRDNTGLTPKGLVEFWTEDNRDAILASLKRPGFAVRIGPDGLSAPFRADPDLLRRIYQAFVPVVPEGDGNTLEYAGNALGDSGQGAQEGETYQQESENRNDDNDEQTEQRPDEEMEEEDPQDPMDPMIPVGEILPLDVLDDFAGRQASPSGNIFALAPAQITIDNGGTPIVQDGVVIFQIDIDWNTRTIAPEALASFVRFDFSVTDPDDLTQRNPSALQPSFEVVQDYFEALLNSAGVPFSSGIGDLAAFSTPTYELTIRQGDGDTVTADVSLDYSDTDGQGVMYTITSSLADLMLTQGEGELAFFSNDVRLRALYTPAELEGIASSGTSIYSGPSSIVFSTLGTPTKLAGVSVGQLEIDFDNRTVGGGSSFLVISAAADPVIGGTNAIKYVALDQAVSFDSGLFGLAFFTLSSLSSDPAVQNGQALVGNFDGTGVNIAAILEDDSNNHLYTEVLLAGGFNTAPLSTISELEGLASTLGTATFHYDGTDAGRGFPGTAEFTRSDGVLFFGDASASIDVNFDNRTVGGGGSFVAVDIDDAFSGFSLSIIETLNMVSFDDAISGMGVFGFGADDFSGANIDNALLLIRNGSSDGDNADLYFNFNDGAGGTGFGSIDNMPRQTGATPTP